MADELEARFRVRLEGKDELSDFFSKADKGAGSFAQNVGKAFSQAGAHMSAFANVAKGVMGSFAGGAFNASIATNARGVLQFRDAVTSLSVSAGLGKDKIEGLRSEIQGVAAASNQMQDDVTASLRAFVEKTGDIETARKNLELYGKVATATGASMADVARVGVELSDKFGIKSQAGAFAILSAQSKAGAVEIRDLATKAPRMFAAAAQFGVKGEEGLRGTGALAQVFAKGFGGDATSANVATSMENTFNDLLKAQGRLKRAGIIVKGRDPYEVIKDIIRKTGGDPEQLLKHDGGGAFDIRAMRGIGVLAREYRETGGFATFDKFKNIKGADINEDYATMASTGEAKVRAADQKFKALADKYLGGIAEFGASHVGELNMLATGAGIAGKGMSAIGSVFGMLGGKSGKGIAGAISNLGVQRVFVVNMPGGGLGGGLGGLPGVAAGGLLAALGAGAAGLVAGGVVGTVIDRKFGLSDKYAKGAFDKFSDKGDGLNETHRQLLELRTEAKRNKVAMLERSGMSHGQAVYRAEHPIKVEVVASVDNDGKLQIEPKGTQSPNVTIRRSVAGGG